MKGLFPDYVSALRFICAELHARPADHVFDELVQERIEVKSRPFARVAEEIIGLLESLKSKGISLGLVTNVMPEEVAAWPQCPLAAYFRTAVFSFSLQKAKPDPDIYREACARLGVAPERRVLFIGDGHSRELEGAERAGLRPLWATWFLNRWPAVWRASAIRDGASNYPELRNPRKLLEWV